MRSALLATAAAAAAVTVFVVATRDPDRLSTILVAIAGAAVATGALVAAALVAVASRRRRGRVRDIEVVRAIRRGAVAGSIVGLIALLRVIDGLTPLTAAFVVGAFAIAEIVLSTRAT